MTGSVLFVQGGGDGAHAADRAVATRLQAALGPDPKLLFPKIGGLDDLDWPSTGRELGEHLAALPQHSVVVAHSVGASAVLKLLSDGIDRHLAHLFLLAPPYTGADGEWGEDDFAFPADIGARLPRGLPIKLWHSRDDEIIPAESAERYRRKLTHAQVILLDGYGHQFEGPLGFLADAIHGALK